MTEKMKEDLNEAIEDLLTTEEMAGKLRVPITWIYSKTRETGPGSIPRIKIGKYNRFVESEVWKWIQKQNGARM